VITSRLWNLGDLASMKVLLHICCAVCAASCVERLRAEGHQVSGFFYNPNVQPPEEYLNRLAAAESLAGYEKFPLLVGEYDPDEWFSQVQDLKDQPEGGERCSKCFSIRLSETARLAREKGFDAFTTTLTISSHKDSEVINDIGRGIAGDLFLRWDFKKNNGSKRANELAQKYDLYRQNYCGCVYSLEERKGNARLQQKARPGGHQSKAS